MNLYILKIVVIMTQVLTVSAELKIVNINILCNVIPTM